MSKSRLRQVTWNIVSHEGSHDDIGGPSVSHQVFVEHVWIGWCKCERPDEDHEDCCHADQSTCAHCNKMLQTTDRVQPEVVPRTTPEENGPSGISEEIRLGAYQIAIARWDMIAVEYHQSQTLVDDSSMDLPESEISFADPRINLPETSLLVEIMVSSTAMSNELRCALCSCNLPMRSSYANSQRRKACRVSQATAKQFRSLTASSHTCRRSAGRNKLRGVGSPERYCGFLSREKKKTTWM